MKGGYILYYRVSGA